MVCLLLDTIFNNKAIALLLKITRSDGLKKHKNVRIYKNIPG
ncbi:hypothetical protein PMI10_03478 [Flavobacterium sp. CF136]|nr:hypothetical protein PMI10_03478 [Flavobacterium sp. CF136]